MVNILSVNSPQVDNFNYKQLDDDGIVARLVMEQTWGDKENRSAAWKLLSAMSGFGTTTKSKKPQWALGDEESRTVTLSEGFILPASDGSKVTVNIDESYIADNQLLHVYEDLGANGIASAVIRYRDATGTDSKRIQFTNNVGTAEANRTFTTGATVTTLPNAAPFDGEVGSGVEIAPIFLDNAMMRSREAVQIGTHTHADMLYVDVSLAKQAQMKQYKIMRDMNKWLYVSNNKKVAQTNFADSGISGGFDCFYRPANDSVVDALGTTQTGLRGVRKLTTGTSITSNLLDEWMLDFTKYGSDEKILFANPSVINKFSAMAKREGLLNYKDRFGMPNNDNYFAEMKSIETTWGKLWLAPDRGATGINKYITDGTTKVTNTEWGVVVDPTLTKIVTHVADGKINKGVQSLKLIPVDTTANNNSIDKAEWDVTQTLMISEPRGGGYIGFGATAV